MLQLVVGKERIMLSYSKLSEAPFYVNGMEL